MAIYEVTKSSREVTEYHAECVGSDGEVSVAVFSGPDAEKLCQEYADWKNGAVRVGTLASLELGVKAVILDGVDITNQCCAFCFTDAPNGWAECFTMVDGKRTPLKERRFGVLELKLKQNEEQA